MKTILAILLMFVCAASAQQVIPKRGKAFTNVAAAGGCSTLRNSNGDMGTTQTPNLAYMASAFIVSNTATICKITLRLTKTGSPTGNMRAGIWTHNDISAPSAQLGTLSDSIAASTLGATTNDVVFSNVSASVTAGQTNWVVLYYDGVVDYANYPNQTLVNTGGILNRQQSSTGLPASWGFDGGTSCGYFTYSN